ncbi:MAG: hypothetical protein GAK29_01483 [Acinetobacter bereziniae]|uniref:Fimbrial protein n=1 Tax=Acinetobacter bereziniae TaxID=106648 RepID=A0A833TZB6_ACIBZ|nr:MAG: hypothetical protein GAK29_01483 [Acinetobacter bereziniae]
MNKYLTVLVGMFLFQSAFAGTYVFGGRAHFNGSLVNLGCSFAQESNLKRLKPVNENSLLELNVSNCSSNVYYNLKFEFAEAIQGTTATEFKAINLMSTTNVLHSMPQFESSKTADESLLSQPDVELINIDETLALPLTFTSGSLPQNGKNILLSVFYP